MCPIGHLAVHPNIYILIQKEVWYMLLCREMWLHDLSQYFVTTCCQAIQKFNLILDKIPVELKKKLKMSMEASDIMYVIIVMS